MKIFFKILLGVVLAGAIAGYIYWQQHKKGIVKNAIQNAIENKSDSLYFIHYDSSQIDEINGNASFYKITLQSDSMQQAMLKAGDSLPNALYNIRAEEVTVRGVDIPGLVQGQHVSAKAIIINKPRIQIINTGADKPKPFTYNDTLELYKKILGRFNSIRGDTIRVVNGTVLITDKKGKPLTTLENINISLNNFLIDSTRNYQNIISYFIKDVTASVENIQLPESANNSRINITNLVYDAPKKILKAGGVQQYKQHNTDALVDIKNVQVSNLNTDAFILFQQLKAGVVTADGGLITIYKKSKKLQSGNESTVLTNDLIDEAQIGGIQLGKTTVIIEDPEKPGKPPFKINDVEFSAADIVSSTNGGTLSNLVSNANWNLSAGGFSFITKNNLYKVRAEGLVLNNKAGTIKVKHVAYKPLLTEAAFVKKLSIQKDRYDIDATDINVSGLNFKKLINDNVLETDEVSLRVMLKVFNDRTLSFDTSSKVGRYPYQALLKLPFQLYIKRLLVHDGEVLYKERGRKSKKTGIVGFTHIDATLSNVTNIAARIKTNSTLVLNAKAQFLNAADIVTEWRMPLNQSDSTFSAAGSLGAMNATVLNSITEPLGLAAIKNGTINKLAFDLTGNNYKSKGNTTFLYNNLGVSVLKMDDNDELKKRGLVSLLANTLIVNNNPKNGNTYTGEIDFERDIHKSFFNFLWKSIFDGVKKTVIRK
ncbi:hypothetical protein QWZ08_02225 [Ferruginibacter paludis]|uniref:hypothetical protein n=1 Tax=Ferruginibacter paludis TaxID=1310417 RepID=UPI0025B51426|nr:hypothetical protein [Ferruginibacter paludis]MDN3654423.1 hypothetical protein [Ferruginibacter paludis]